MKDRTDEEIVAEVKRLIEERLESGYYFTDDPEVIVTRVPNYHDGYHYGLKISAMYGSPKLDFKQMDQLAEFFDTMKIETGSEFGSQGCDTCDYGSEYGYTLYVSPGDPYTDLGVRS